MSKQTSVEWLQECLSIHLTHEQKQQFEGLFQQAKEMEKEQIERMYSEEDLRKAYFSGISSTGEGWNGEYANGNDPNIEEKFSAGFTQWFEQFKKK